MGVSGRRRTCAPARNERAPARESAWRLVARFAGPSYWPAWCFWGWLRLTAWLPLGAALGVHRPIGRLVYRLSPKQRRVVRRNLELCFPELSPAEIEQLTRRHFVALGESFAESAAAWLAPARRLEGRFDIVGREHLDAALALGKGVILYTGHFTTLEICGRAFKQLTPRFGCMFSRRRNELLDEIQFRGRMRIAHDLIPRDSVRSMLRSLKNNAAVWYAPDRLCLDGELIPFFHELAMTNVSTSKLARISGAAVVPFSYRRCGGRGRYELRFHPALDHFPTEDLAADTRRLVESLEQFIRACPEQYLWMHKRFKGRPAPLPDLYRRASEPLERPRSSEPRRE